MPVSKKTKIKIRKKVSMEELPISARAQMYMKENLSILENHQLKARFVVANRNKKQGIVNKMALWVLRHTGSYIDIEFTNLTK